MCAKSGSHRLSKVVLAVDRGNANVASYYQEFHPAVLNAIKVVVDGCHVAGIHAGVCGDMASHPATALTLFALGVDEISASVNAIPELKACFSSVSKDQLKSLAEALLGANSAEEAQASAARLLPDRLLPWTRK